MLHRWDMVDQFGDRIAPTLHGVDPDALDAVLLEMLQLSCATNDAIYEVSMRPPAGLGLGDTVYPTVYDMAVLRFATSNFGGNTPLIIPCPDSSIFMVDGETVDPTRITDLIAAVLAGGYSVNGQPLTAYIGGNRRRMNRKGGF